jgi:hypothetical protein
MFPFLLFKLHPSHPSDLDHHGALDLALERSTMEAMLNGPELSVDVSRNGVWDKICLAYPVLASNVGIIYLAVV